MDRSRELASRLFFAKSVGNCALWRGGCSAAKGGISINLLTVTVARFACGSASGTKGRSVQVQISSPADEDSFGQQY